MESVAGSVSKGPKEQTRGPEFESPEPRYKAVGGVHACHPSAEEVDRLAAESQESFCIRCLSVGITGTTLPGFSMRSGQLTHVDMAM